MAKMGEGHPYYYLPHSYNQNGFKVCKRAEHPNKLVIVETVDQDNASLIVDALNFYQTFKIDGTIIESRHGKAK